VVLAACNTAAGESYGAEALSGLAQAFFYAGSRSLLVSRWEVDSEPTSELMIGFFEAMRKAPEIGRAEAMRRSIASYIEKANDLEIHPSNWAAFILVGEGGSGQ